VAFEEESIVRNEHREHLNRKKLPQVYYKKKNRGKDEIVNNSRLGKVASYFC